MEFIESILSGISHALSLKELGLDTLYIVASIVLPTFYYRQISKYLKGDKGVGDFCFSTEIIQASLRVPALLYCVSIANGPVFISVLLDLIGRSAKIVVAKVVHMRHKLQEMEEDFVNEVSENLTLSTSSVTEDWSVVKWTHLGA